MKKLWVFGDSFSADWKQGHDYTNWKGYIPKVHCYVIAEELGLEPMNMARHGISNNDILESVCENIHRISEEDVVMIGWTSIYRFRLANRKLNKWDYWQSGLWESNKKYGVKGTPDISKSTIDELFINRMDSELYKTEILKWINLLRYTFKSNTFINWNWSKSEWKQEPFGYETINEETNGFIDDLHWSESGQFQFAQWAISKIREGGFINDLSYLV